MGFAGCTKRAQTVNEEGATPSDSAENPVVIVYTWDEYFDLPLLERFKERTGLEVRLETYESSDEMLEHLKSSPGKYDVVISEDGYVSILSAKRLLGEFDHSQLPNLSKLDDRYLNQAFDPGNKVSIPYTWGTTLLAYRKDLLPNPKQSWSELKNPSLKGKVSLLDERMECFCAMLRLRGARLEQSTPEQIGQAGEDLEKLMGEQEAALGDDNEMKAHLLDGRSWLAMMYSGDAAKIAEENPDKHIAYFIPEEGATLWIDSYCLVRDAPHPANAHRFINFMLEPESAAASTNFLHYATPNKEANALIENDVLEDPTIYPPKEVLDKCQPLSLLGPHSQRSLNIAWGRVQDMWRSRAAGSASVPSDAEKSAEKSASDSAKPAEGS